MEAALVHHGLTRRRWLATAGVPLLGACASPGSAAPPPLPREFRAAWVATVANIDWPSRPGLPAASQRAEMTALLDLAQQVGLNALVLQVRPTADVIYPSALEPWSDVLGGASGQAPDARWDPLAEWVDGAHARGLELHAWFNPYRVRHPSALGERAATHVAHAEPGIVRTYGEQLWMDPAEPRAADRLLAVVAEVLQRYDVDGVHIDDYFYPYPVRDAAGTELPFPDDGPWQRHRAATAGADTVDERAAWRRAQVDRLVERLAREVHALRPWVRVGISPFGLPRPDLRPPGIEGFSQYHRLHADVERWLAEGWLDYLAPQLYWAIEPPAQSFPVLLQAWRRANRLQRHLWPGLFTSRIGAERNPYDAAQVLAQVALSREGAAPDAGHLHFSLKALRENRDGIADALRSGPYAEAALPPATPWLAEPPPQPPLADRARQRDGTPVLWPRAADGPPLRHAVLWQRVHGHWRWQALPMPAGRGFTPDPAADARALVGVGRSGLESAARAIRP